MYCKNDNSQLSMTKTPVVSSGHLHFYWMFQCAPGWDPRLLIEMMVTSPRSSDRFMFWLRFIHMTICGWTIYSFNPKDSSRMIQLYKYATWPIPPFFNTQHPHGFPISSIFEIGCWWILNSDRWFLSNHVEPTFVSSEHLVKSWMLADQISSGSMTRP